MNTDRVCPAKEELSAFAIGDLNRLDYDRVEQHLDECEDCKDHLRSYDDHDDGMLSRLKSGTTGSKEDVPDAILRVARNAVKAEVRDQFMQSNGPKTVGPFELLETVGRGAFGHVFRARDTELGRIVALKILRAGRFASEEDLDRFRREARSTAQLKHPGIVLLYGAGQTEEETPYLIEEFISGTTLAEDMKRQPYSHGKAVRIVLEIAQALSYAHRNGVIHRDIKPSNILIDEKGRPHVSDFGLAKWEAEDATMTPDGLVMGTPDYMSPEQARGEVQSTDERTDVYSLGVILYELLVGSRPFQGNRRQVLLQVLDHEPRHPRRLDSGIPRDLDTICMKAMAKLATDRYRSAGALAEDLSLFLRGEPIRARRIGLPEAFWRWWRRNPVAASLLLAASLGSLLGVWHLFRLTEKQMIGSALKSAANQTQVLEEFIGQYSAKVVDRLGHLGIQATHNYHESEGDIPLPTTLLIEVGRSISDRKLGMQIRHYSDFPFRFRQDGGLTDEFARKALEQLRRAPQDPYYTIDENFEGVPALRYARARLMSASCVSCHNSHPDSTKRDWEAGDVRGVLEIIRPLSKDLDEARRGLKGTYAVMGGIFASLMLFSLVVLGVSGAKRRNIF